MGLLETGMAHLGTVMASALEVPLTVSRSGVTVSTTGTRGSTPFEASDADGIIHRTVRRDYLIRVDAWPFTEAPRDGDIITDAGSRYMVQSIPGEHPWRHIDPAKTIFRIHTKEQ